MSATQKERAEFVAVLTEAFPKANPFTVARIAAKIMRHAATIKRLAEESCNGHPAQSSPTLPAATIGRLQDKWDKRIEQQEQRAVKNITQAASELGLTVNFGGDPRGYTVKVQLPTGRHNTWGGREDGWGVPTS